MRRIWTAVALVTITGLACPLLLPAEDKGPDAPKLAIKEVMQKAFKGDNALQKTVVSGKADDATIKQFLDLTQALAANKPKKGDEAAWKDRVKSITDATQGLLDKKDSAMDALKTATNCKTCHDMFK